MGFEYSTQAFSERPPYLGFGVVSLECENVGRLEGGNGGRWWAQAFSERPPYLGLGGKVRV